MLGFWGVDGVVGLLMGFGVVMVFGDWLCLDGCGVILVWCCGCYCGFTG